MVVAGVGVDHHKLCEATQKYFVDLKPAWELQPDLANQHKQITVDNSYAQYTGGFVQVRHLFTPLFIKFFLTSSANVLLFANRKNVTSHNSHQQVSQCYRT